MKKIISFAFLLFIFGLNLFAQTELWNNGWRYQRGDFPEAKSADYNDSDWEFIGLPHSFSIPYFMSDEFYVGYGWYRKHLNITKIEKETKQIYLDFDGVFLCCEVYVNGKQVGGHSGGYTGFRVDLTSNLNVGDNVVAVRVNNNWNPIVAPRAGEHVFSGGIYRSVRLVKKNPIHIDWCGLAINTPGLKESQGVSATIDVKCDVCLPKIVRTKPKLNIVVEIFDADNNSVVVMKNGDMQKYSIKEKHFISRSSYIHASAKIDNPHLWSPSKPYIYKAVCRLYDDQKLLDEETQTFGFRWFEWTTDKGFFINGEHLYFRGANVHQDQAGWGDAVTEEAARRDVRMVKEAGFDMIRGSHYPHAPYFVDECDKQGLLFWSEMNFWSTYGKYKDNTWNGANPYPLNIEQRNSFEHNTLKQLEEMILIHRNHPSVFVWCMCNEVFFSTPQTALPIKSLLKDMVNYTHKLDSTRVAAIGGSQRPKGRSRIDLIGDIAGYNGDGAVIEDFQMPAKPCVVTEYGSTLSERPGKYEPGWGFLAQDDAWKGLPWRSGQAIWCAFDHGSIMGQDMAKLGIIDYFRIPKRSWYWYRNEYANVPPPAWPVEGTPASLVIETSRNNEIKADGTDDVMLLVKVLDANGNELSNSPDVLLQIISGPGLFPTGRCIKFSKDSDVRILDGKAAITLRSYFSGKTVVRATSANLKPVTVKIKFIGGPSYSSQQKNIDKKNANVIKTPYSAPVHDDSNANYDNSGAAFDKSISNQGNIIEQK